MLCMDDLEYMVTLDYVLFIFTSIITKVNHTLYSIKTIKFKTYFLLYYRCVFQTKMK